MVEIMALYKGSFLTLGCISGHSQFNFYFVVKKLLQDLPVESNYILNL